MSRTSHPYSFSARTPRGRLLPAAASTPAHARSHARAADRRARGFEPSATLLAFVVVATLAITLWSATRPAEPPQVDAWAAVTVSAQSTLWSIAEAHPVPGLSTAESVALIRERNNLDGNVVHAGLVITAPASADGAGSVASR